MNNTLLDVHGAGAQRSDPKSGNANDYPLFFGPQGDVRYVYNYVRVVRDISTATSSQSIKKALNIDIYPNPVNNNINVRFNTLPTDNISIELFNIAGRKMKTLYTGIVNANVKSFNLGHLTTGIYFVKIESTTFTTTKKITKF